VGPRGFEGQVLWPDDRRRFASLQPPIVWSAERSECWLRVNNIANPVRVHTA